MKPYDLTSEEYKTYNEIFRFQSFIDCVPELSGETLFEKSESPDAIFTVESKRIGVELTDYYSDESLAGGSMLRRFESDTDEIIERAKSAFEEQNPTTLRVIIVWNDSHWKAVSRDEKHRLPSMVCNFVLGCVKSEQYGIMDWSYLNPSGLDRYIVFIDVLPANTPLWSKSFGGHVPAVSPERLREIIATKETKLSEFLSRCDECWLLIYGASNGMSSVIDFQDSVIQLGNEIFDTEFQRVFYFDGWTKKTIELGLHHSGTINPHRLTS